MDRKWTHWWLLHWQISNCLHSLIMVCSDHSASFWQKASKVGNLGCRVQNNSGSQRLICWRTAEWGWTKCHFWWQFFVFNRGFAGPQSWGWKVQSVRLILWTVTDNTEIDYLDNVRGCKERYYLVHSHCGYPWKARQVCHILRQRLTIQMKL